MRSRISTGFHRLGLVLSLPLLLGAAFVTYQQVMEPSGAYVVDLPEGAQAWKPEPSSTAERQVVQALISDQERAGIVAPPGFIVVGKPVGTARLKDTDWTKFQLRDGREIGIASTDNKVVTDTVNSFVWSEKTRGQPYRDKDNIQFDGVRVAFLDWWNQDPQVGGPWPQHRQRDWTFALLLAAAGVLVYVLLRLFAWVIDGFVGSPSVRAKQ